jgi:primase-polymerase (primpol)-like protein
VRDPETGEIHPVCAETLQQAGGYAEISQSGEGVHQFLFGEIPGGFSKFLRHIDDGPFVGDDLPMVEMYSSGRLVAMTGNHVEVVTEP